MRLARAATAGAVVVAAAGGCVVTDDPGLPFDVRVQTVGIADGFDVHLDVTRVHLTDGTTIEANDWHFVTGDPQPGDLVLAGAGPRWVGTFRPDGTTRNGPCYRVDGSAQQLDADSITLTLREDGHQPVRFTVVSAPGWDERPPDGGGRTLAGDSTCLDAQGRAVERR